MIQLALPSFLFSLLLLEVLSSYFFRRWEQGVLLINGGVLNLVRGTALAASLRYTLVFHSTYSRNIGSTGRDLGIRLPPPIDTEQ